MYDVEAIVVEYLSENLTCSVSSEVPNPRPDYLVTVERTGGPMALGIDRPTIALQAWAPTRFEAQKLGNRVCATISDIDELACVSQVTINSFYNFPTEHDEQRYQLIVDLVMY